MEILLYNNKLTALHPKTFSHLRNLIRLSLSDNVCVNTHFYPVTSISEIEKALKRCGAEYALREPSVDSEQSRFEGIANKIDEKFELLTKKFEGNHKMISSKVENLENSFNQRFETIEKTITGNFESRFEEMEKKFNERNEENAQEIRDIKNMVEKIYSMTRSK
jgi:hypothetical protein